MRNVFGILNILIIFKSALSLLLSLGVFLCWPPIIGSTCDTTGFFGQDTNADIVGSLSLLALILSIIAVYKLAKNRKAKPITVYLLTTVSFVCFVSSLYLALT